MPTFYSATSKVPSFPDKVSGCTVLRNTSRAAACVTVNALTEDLYKYGQRAWLTREDKETRGRGTGGRLAPVRIHVGPFV